MQKQNKVARNNEIRSELTAKWPKISNAELGMIVSRHGELKEVLKYKYDMTKEEALKTAAKFFKRFKHHSGGTSYLETSAANKSVV